MLRLRRERRGYTLLFGFGVEVMRECHRGVGVGFHVFSSFVLIR